MHLLVLSVVPVDTYHDETLGSDERHTYMLYLFQDETFFGDITLSGVMSSGSNKTNQTKLTLDVIDMSTTVSARPRPIFSQPLLSPLYFNIDIDLDIGNDKDVDIFT